MAIVVATNTVTLAHNGQQWVIRRGEAWDSADPLVRHYPDLFTPVAGEHVHRTEAPVETATRAPGERRTVRRA